MLGPEISTTVFQTSSVESLYWRSCYSHFHKNTRLMFPAVTLSCSILQAASNSARSVLSAWIGWLTDEVVQLPCVFKLLMSLSFHNKNSSNIWLTIETPHRVFYFENLLSHIRCLSVSSRQLNVKVRLGKYFSEADRRARFLGRIRNAWWSKTTCLQWPRCSRPR